MGFLAIKGKRKLSMIPRFSLKTRRQAVTGLQPKTGSAEERRMERSRFRSRC